MTFISHNECDITKIEYVNSLKEYVIPQDTYATVDEVWNIYTKKTIPCHLVKKIVKGKQREICQTIEGVGEGGGYLKEGF